MKRRTVIYLDYIFYEELLSKANELGLSLSSYINLLIGTSSVK